MTILWVIWVVYVIAFIVDYFYVQPVRQLRGARVGQAHKAGTISFSIRVALPLFTVLLLTRTFGFNGYFVPTESMAPALTEGSRIWVNRLAYGVRSPLTGNAWFAEQYPRRGEVVVFHYPREPRTVYVKRLIGLPGDHIQIDGDRIRLNDSLLNPDAGHDKFWQVSLDGNDFVLQDDPTIESDVSLDLVVPSGHFFAIGDNIDHSEDSRTWGFVAAPHLIGRVIGM